MSRTSLSLVCTLLAASLLACQEACAQRLLVRTTTLSAAREAVRVYLHSVDLGRGESLPLPELLPGPTPLGPILLTSDGSGAVASSGPRWTGGEFHVGDTPTFISVYHTAPFRAVPGQRLLSQEGWRQYAACLAQDPRNETPILVLLGVRVDEYGNWRGRLEARRWERTAETASEPRSAAWPLPGAPMAATTLHRTTRVAVLCRSRQETGALLHARDVVTGQVLVEAKSLGDDPAGRLGTEPAGLALSRDGSCLFVLTAGHPLDRPSGEASSWLHALDPIHFEPLLDPVELPGVAEPGDNPLLPAEGRACWVTTRTPRSGFAYLFRVRAGPDSLAKEEERSYVNVSRPLRIALAPEDHSVAVACERRLEILEDGRVRPLPDAYDAPIRALAWDRQGLIAAEGNRIHRLDPATGDPGVTVSFSTGWPADFVSLPAERLPPRDEDADGVPAPDERKQRTSPSLPDTDDDGIPDGIDPEPTVPSPFLRLPALVTFRGEAAGRQWRAVMLDPPHGKSCQWRIDFDAKAMPWLRVYPQSGVLPGLGVFYIGVDPAQYGAPQGVVGGRLRVHVSGKGPGSEAAGSPATTYIRVEPQRGRVQRILWMWERGAAAGQLRSTKDPHGFRALADLLAGPPYYFSHREISGPFSESLTPHAIVVLGAAAAARGAVTRQAILDYVAAGGALLFFGKQLDLNASRALTRWLSPLGIHVDSAARVEGVFGTNRRDWLCRHWTGFRIADGCEIRADDPSMILVPGTTGTEQAILVTTAYGRGRIAMLAAPTPLETDALQAETNRLFALDLFRWLAAAGKDVDDLDEDGLTDATEDRNANGFVDPGETDRLNPDTDGDGIPDGIEDINRNGQVDEGETSPRNPDSDGDGTRDGADTTPLPPADAPHVANVEPAEGPREGGVQVLVSGRNFSPDSAVWFGRRASPRVRTLGAMALVAETPPSEPGTGPDVDVRVVNPSIGLEGTLPTGFHYRPRSMVLLTLEAAQAAKRLYKGTLTIRLDCPLEVNVGRIALQLEAWPRGAINWVDTNPGASAEYARRIVLGRPTPSGGMRVDISEGKRGPSAGEAATIRWTRSKALKRRRRVSIRIEDPRMWAPNGEPLEVKVAEQQIRVNVR